MHKNRRQSRISASPMLVGAVTTIIAVVGVFFSYNANMGLPFVPTYRINAELPSGAALVKGNEVRTAGVRVGIVNSVKPKQLPSGRSIARVDLKLDKSAQPVPENSTITVRQRSAMGLKYLLLTPGDSDRGLPAGGTIPLSQVTPETVDMDQFFNMFQAPVRKSIQRNLAEYGGMFATRGADINEILGQLPHLLQVAEPVTKNLSSRRTDLSGFIKGLSQAAAEVVPVAQTQADMFVALDSTFSALATVARPYMQESITESVKTQVVIQEEGPRIRPFLYASARFMNAFLPGARTLGAKAPIITKSLETGTPVLRQTPKIYNELGPTARALRQFGESTPVNRGLDSVIEMQEILVPLVSQVTPSQNVCNYLSLLLRNVSEIVSAGGDGGRWVRAISMIPPYPPQGPNSESGPASAPASGSLPPPAGTDPNFLHYNPYPNTAAPGQPRECEAGNEGYAVGQVQIGNFPGNQGIETQNQSKKQLNWKTR